MESREGALGPAITRFSDYVGTVEADDAEGAFGQAEPVRARQHRP
jgi:hypothetical protein